MDLLKSKFPATPEELLEAVLSRTRHDVEEAVKFLNDTRTLSPFELRVLLTSSGWSVGKSVGTGPKIRPDTTNGGGMGRIEVKYPFHSETNRYVSKSLAESEQSILDTGEQTLPREWRPRQSHRILSLPTSPLDWLHLHEEVGQTFPSYKRNRMIPPRSQTIYIQPVDPFSVTAGELNLLAQFTSATLGGAPVQVLPAVVLGKTLYEAAGGTPTEYESYHYLHLSAPSTKPTKKNRKNAKRRKVKAPDDPLVCVRKAKKVFNAAGELVPTSNGHRQLMLSHLKEGIEQLVDDCEDKLLIAITDEDLFEDDQDLMTMGLAWLYEGIGVFSAARYSQSLTYGPDWWFDVRKSSPAPKAEMGTFPVATERLRRLARILAHEAGHLLQLRHCLVFECLMNGSGHVAEDVRQPLRLCPCCMRKMCWRGQQTAEVYLRAVDAAIHAIEGSHAVQPSIASGSAREAPSEGSSSQQVDAATVRAARLARFDS